MSTTHKTSNTSNIQLKFSLNGDSCVSDLVPRDSPKTARERLMLVYATPLESVVGLTQWRDLLEDWILQQVTQHNWWFDNCFEYECKILVFKQFLLGKFEYINTWYLQVVDDAAEPRRMDAGSTLAGVQTVNRREPKKSPVIGEHLLIVLSPLVPGLITKKLKGTNETQREFSAAAKRGEKLDKPAEALRRTVEHHGNKVSARGGHFGWCGPIVTLMVKQRYRQRGDLGN